MSEPVPDLTYFLFYYLRRNVQIKNLKFLQVSYFNFCFLLKINCCGNKMHKVKVASF